MRNAQPEYPERDKAGSWRKAPSGAVANTSRPVAGSEGGQNDKLPVFLQSAAGQARYPAHAHTGDNWQWLPVACRPWPGTGSGADKMSRHGATIIIFMFLKR